MKWDPNEHPRNPLGRFTEILRGMKSGQSVDLPDGHRVEAHVSKRAGRSERRFKVHAPAGDMGEAIQNLVAGRSIQSKTHRLAENAARDALDRSAQSAHPNSLGGKKRYKDLADFERKGS